MVEMGVATWRAINIHKILKDINNYVILTLNSNINDAILEIWRLVNWLLCGACYPMCIYLIMCIVNVVVPTFPFKVLSMTNLHNHFICMCKEGVYVGYVRGWCVWTMKIYNFKDFLMSLRMVKIIASLDFIYE